MSTHSHLPSTPPGEVGLLFRTISDGALRDLLQRSWEELGAALLQLDGLKLEALELAPTLEERTPWPELEGPVTALLRRLSQVERAIRAAASSLAPGAEACLAGARELVPEDLATRIPSPIRDQLEVRLDAALRGVEAGATSALRRSLVDLSSVLEAVVAEHAARLSVGHRRADGRALVNELHELKSRARMVLEAMGAAELRFLSEASPQANLPRYRTGGARAAALRGWATRLAEALEGLKSSAPEAPIGLALTIIADACRGPEVDWLRATDRAEIQSFRRWAIASEGAPSDEALERLARVTVWARMMGRINRRPLLARHDLEALATLESTVSEYGPSEVGVELLEPLLGRDERLDDLIDAAQAPGQANLSSLRPLLPVLRAVIQGSAGGSSL